MPDSFYAIDGLIDTFITILNQMEVYPGMIKKERERYSPFLATTTLLMESVKQGAGREAAYEAIKSQAVAVAQAMRSGEMGQNNLVERLGSDKRFGLDAATIERVIEEAQALTGIAKSQVKEFSSKVEELLVDLPEAKKYSPEAIL